MFAGATSSTELTDDAVASVGTSAAAATYYTDLQEAFTALAKGTATANYKLTVLKDVTLSEGLVFTDPSTSSAYPDISGRYEFFLVDLGGCTVTLENGSQPVLSTVASSSTSSIGIRNGTLIAKGTTPGALDIKTCWVHIINVAMSSESATSTCRFHDATKNRNGALKGCEVTNTAAGGVAVEFNGFQGFVHSSTLVAASGTALYVNQLRDDFGGVAVATSTLTGSVAVGLSSDSARDVYLTGGTFTGELRDPNAHLYICGGTYTVNPSEFVGSGYEVVENGGTYAVSDAAAVQVDDVDSNMANAFNLSGVTTRTIKLNGDVFLIGLEEKKDLIAVGEGQNITIDLNGHDINIFDVSASFSNVNCGSVKKDGVLTITDSSGTDSGRLTFAAWMMDFRDVPGYANNMFTLGGTSVMNVESGILENISYYKNGWTYATYCVDNNSEAQSTLNITGGKIIHTNTAIRMFFGNTAKLTMTGGEVYGGNSALWVQGGKVEVSITGGKITGLVNAGSYGAIYTTATPSGKLILGGTLEYTGGLRCFATGNEEFCEITGGTFIDDGTKYFLYGYAGGNVVKITGGVFDPCYLYYHNYMKYWSGFEKYYLNVEGAIRIEEDERYHFGEPVAELVDWEPMGYVYSAKLPYVYEAYSSLPLALAHAGEYQYVMENNTAVFGSEARLNADDSDAKPHVFGDDLDLGFDIYLNGHTVTSTSTEPLISVTNDFTTALNFMDEGTIRTAGPVLKLNDQASATFYDGLYLSSGETLFDATPTQLKVPVNTAAAGEPFDLNRAGFSHDMSASVENVGSAPKFITRQSKTDRNWYLARKLKAE